MINKYITVNRTTLPAGTFTHSNNFIWPHVGSVRQLWLGIQFRATGAGSSDSFTLANFLSNSQLQIWNRFGELCVDSDLYNIFLYFVYMRDPNVLNSFVIFNTFGTLASSRTPGTSGSNYQVVVPLVFPQIMSATQFDDMRNTYDFSNFTIRFPSSLGNVSFSQISFIYTVTFNDNFIIFTPQQYFLVSSTQNRIIHLPRKKYRGISLLEILSGTYLKVYTDEGLYAEYIRSESLYSAGEQALFQYLSVDTIANIKETTVSFERDSSDTTPLIQVYYTPNDLSRYNIDFNDIDFKVVVAENSPNVSITDAQAKYLPVITRKTIEKNRLEDIKSRLR